MALKVLSAGAVKRGVAHVAQDYEAASGEAVAIEFDTAPSLRRRLLSGEPADVVVLPPAVLDELAQQGRVDNVHRGYIGRSRVGVFVKRGGQRPDLATAADFRRAVLDADAVVYNTASSGLYIEQLLQRLGVFDAVASKIVKVQSGAAVMQQVAAHPGHAIGTGQLSEIRVQLDKGVAIDLVAPLPDEIQNATPYDAAATKPTPAACALVAALASDAAKKIFAETGID